MECSVGYLVSPVGILRIMMKKGKVIQIDNKATGAEPACLIFDHALEEVKGQILEYFDGKRTTFDFEIEPEGTEFQKDVWQVLRTIPYGQTLSYKQVAEAVGRPDAQRACGTAIGKNPILIAIPCHRVIKSDGTLGGFSAGLENKVILHKLEGIVTR